MADPSAITPAGTGLGTALAASAVIVFELVKKHGPTFLAWVLRQPPPAPREPPEPKEHPLLKVLTRIAEAIEGLRERR